MSAHDYMSRSGHSEDAYAYPEHVTDARGKRWYVNGYGHSLGTHAYVRKVESYVQEIRKSKPDYYSSVTIGFPSKESGPFNNYGRPREVHDFLTKILTEVNGPPSKTGGPNTGTNQGEHNFPHEPPPRTSAPNLERVQAQEVDHRYGPYGTSPVKVDPTRGPPARPSDSNWGRGRGSFPVKEAIRESYGDGHRYGSSLAKAEPPMAYRHHYEYDSSPRKSERAPNHQWGRSSSPIYDHQPQGGYGVPNHEGGGYGLNSEAPRSSSPIYGHPSQRNYQLPDDKWGSPLKSQTQDYGAPDNSPPRKPSSLKDREVQNNGRGGSPMKSHVPYGYGLSPNNTYAAKPEEPTEYKIPDSRWGNPEARDYGVPSNKWDKPSSPIDDHPRDNPEEQLGGSTMNPRGYGVSGNQWNRSSSPVYNHPGNNPSSPKNQWGSSSAKTESPRNYGVPSNQQGKSSTPGYTHPQNSPPNPKNQWGNSPMKTESPKGYRPSSNQWDRSSNPIYDHLGSNPSGPKNHWGSSPVKTQSPRDYGAPINQQSTSSGPVYDHLRNNASGPKDQWGSSPVKTQGQGPRGYGFSSDQWERPSSPGYETPPTDEQYKPPQVTCKDGVCTLNNKPKAPQGAYDEPKGNTNRFPVTEPASYSDDRYGAEGLRLKPYSPDHQPKDFGRTTNHMKSSGYNLGESLEQLNLDAGTPPEGAPAVLAGKSSVPAAGLSGTRKLTVAPPVASIRVTMVAPRDIDSEEAVRRYGGCSIPGKPYARGEDQNETRTSGQALEKHRGFFVPKPK